MAQKPRLRRSTGLNYTIAITDDAGVAIDCTGCSARLQIRERPGDPVLLTLTTQDQTAKGSYLDWISKPDGTLTWFVSGQDSDGTQSGDSCDTDVFPLVTFETGGAWVREYACDLVVFDSDDLPTLDGPIPLTLTFEETVTR
jgi:hypothetical protein